MDKNRNITSYVIGLILIAVGFFTLLGRFFTFINLDDLWPLIIVAVGAAFFIAMLVGGKNLGGLAVTGSILVTIGLILFVMNITDRWEAWSYAWALIVCAVGAGSWLNGVWSDRLDLRQRGLKTLRLGLGLFLVFGILMEFIFSASGESRWGSILLWSILLALLGLSLLVARLLRLGKTEGERVDLFWPILMIGVGVVTSLAYLGWLPKENLWALVNLWPLLLIVFGVGLLFRGRSPWVGASLGVLVVLVAFVVIAAGDRLGLKPGSFGLFEPGPIQFGDYFGEDIIGSGNVITEKRSVSGFDRVQMGIPGNLEIQQGSIESLTVSGEENILPLLATEVRGDTLMILFKPSTNIRVKIPLQITITVKNLEELQVSSSSQVVVKPLTTKDFRLMLSSSGSVDIEEIQAEAITADLTSSGDIFIKGNARQLDLTVTSSGSFQGADLQVQQAEVRLSSSGEVTLWVTEDLEVNISSSGNVAYFGNPNVNKVITSSGELIPRGEK